MQDKKSQHAYWRNPPSENAPGQYTLKKSHPFLVDVLKSNLPDGSARILEVGCNVGRNLNALWKVGYRNLHGVEINPNAVDLMRKEYADMMRDVNVSVCPIEEFVFGQYDCIFTMAVLCHIHPDSEFIFQRMANSSETILTIEDEHGRGARHQARNYRLVFQEFGFEEAGYWHKIEGMNPNYHARLMRRTAFGQI